ncbi:MAG TPA: hypothetical protein VNK46_16120 [Nitrospiraceae bacterium]|jgi:hypothetical protein|nr:hypothetical protein [Nitrospiraceae bacterium]
MKTLGAAPAVWLAALVLLVCGMLPDRGLGQSLDEATIRGALPRTPSGAVDLAQVREVVAGRFAQGARAVQFRDFTLDVEESRSLLLSVERNQNLLAHVGAALPADGVERTVTFRGVVDGQQVEARVQRQEDGTLRARIEGVHVGTLSDADREQLVQRLSQQTGFERVRLEGFDGGGNRVRTEFRVDSGLVRNEVKSEGRGRPDGGSVRTDGRQAERRDDRRLDRQMDRRDERIVERHEDRRIDRQGDGRVERIERNQRVERVERVERIERSDRSGRTERPERPDRSGR